MIQDIRVFKVIKDILKEKNPGLSKSSRAGIATYLISLHKKVFKNTTFDTENFNKTQKIIDFLKDIPPNKRKTILASLVLISDKKEYSVSHKDYIL